MQASVKNPIQSWMANTQICIIFIGLTPESSFSTSSWVYTSFTRINFEKAVEADWYDLRTDKQFKQKFHFVLLLRAPLGRSQSYQILISLFFRISLLSLSVFGTRKYCLYFEMAKLKRKKNGKNLHFMKKKVW
jgi:hypothetical protein